MIQKDDYKNTLVWTILDGLDKNAWGAKEDRAMRLANSAEFLLETLKNVRRCLSSEGWNDAVQFRIGIKMIDSAVDAAEGR